MDCPPCQRKRTDYILLRNHQASGQKRPELFWFWELEMFLFQLGNRLFQALTIAAKYLRGIT